jgi:hypothetical protein
MRPRDSGPTAAHEQRSITVHEQNQRALVPGVSLRSATAFQRRGAETRRQHVRLDPTLPAQLGSLLMRGSQRPLSKAAGASASKKQKDAADNEPGAERRGELPYAVQAGEVARSQSEPARNQETPQNHQNEGAASFPYRLRVRPAHETHGTPARDRGYRSLRTGQAPSLAVATANRLPQIPDWTGTNARSRIGLRTARYVVMSGA